MSAITFLSGKVDAPALRRSGPESAGGQRQAELVGQGHGHPALLQGHALESDWKAEQVSQHRGVGPHGEGETAFGELEPVVLEAVERLGIEPAGAAENG